MKLNTFKQNETKDIYKKHSLVCRKSKEKETLFTRKKFMKLNNIKCNSRLSLV